MFFSDSKLALVTHKIIMVVFPVIEPLTVLMAAQSFIFLHTNAVSGSMKYFKKNFLKTEIFHEIFQTQKKHVFFTSLIMVWWEGHGRNKKLVKEVGEAIDTKL